MCADTPPGLFGPVVASRKSSPVPSAFADTCRVPLSNVEIHYPRGSYGMDEEADSHYLDDVAVTLTVGADYFSCQSCQLVLNGYDLLRQAGLDTEFVVDGDPDDYVGQEPEYRND